MPSEDCERPLLYFQKWKKRHYVEHPDILVMNNKLFAHQLMLAATGTYHS